MTAEQQQEASSLEPPPEIQIYASQITEYISRLESLGLAGELESAYDLLYKIEEIREKKSALELQHQQMTVSVTKGNQSARIRVCDVCGARLSITDTDKRLADHFGGKLHVGFVKIRQKLKELNVYVENLAMKHAAESRKRRR
ncbi:hypothetical protein RCL1_008552 [Eukaryota sp. TZLM3-RCL]